ncbi:MAG: pyridoxal-phosphate dependent enzyme [Acidimicrobiales bacterium]
MTAAGETRWTLPSGRVPEAWFNAAGHLPTPLQPPLDPQTREPLGRDALAGVLPLALVDQELTADPWVVVPGGVQDLLRQWRPTPLVRARRLEVALATPARIYFKDESVSPTGSHHPATAAAQAFYAKAEGASRLVTESDTGRWGSALSWACALSDLSAVVYTGSGASMAERIRIQAWGAKVMVDRAYPGDDALGDATGRPDTRFAPGSVFNHVVLHQTVIGLEAKEQLALAGEERPDVVIGHCGGGSSLAGTALPFVGDDGVRLVAVEPSSWPALASGRFDHVPGDAGGRLPLMAMYALGPDSAPPAINVPSIHSGGIAPIVCELVRRGRMEAVAHPLAPVLRAAVYWSRTEGPLPALTTAHALRAVVDEAVLAREEGRERVILFPWVGHGIADLGVYGAFLDNQLD